MLRRMVVVACAALSFAALPTLGEAQAAPAAVTARYVDTATVPWVPTFGGISGIDRTGNGTYTMISTDVGRAGPGRFYTARIGYSPTAGAVATPAITGGGPILGPGNLPPLPGSAQFEGIRKFGGGYVVAGGGANQFVRVLGGFGTYTRDLGLPAAWRPSRTSGLAGQRGLTGVAVAPSGKISAITAGGLRQDAPKSARLISFGRPNTEYVYRTDADKVAADVLAVNDTDFLVLERGPGRVTRIYWTTTRGADQVGGRAKLSGREKAMSKTQIFSTAPLPRLTTGNMSGIAWGNWLPDRPWLTTRGRALFVVTNDAFAGPTRVHALEVQFPKR
ncbi:hypothetical protein GCM10009624_24790 [Gordonia sinesedis]